MSAEAWPTEGAATVAVDAAARKFFEDAMERQAAALPPSWEPPTWEGLGAAEKLNLRQQVLPLIWAALEALPDPRHTAWLEGLYCGLRQGYEDDNPYPSGS